MTERASPSEAYVAKLEDAIAYQKNAIVSKVITSKSGGSVTLFAYDEGQGVSEQFLPFDCVLFVLDGEIEIEIDGNDPQAVKTGYMIYIPAGVSHSIMSGVPFKVFSILIRDNAPQN